MKVVRCNPTGLCAAMFVCGHSKLHIEWSGCAPRCPLGDGTYATCAETALSEAHGFLSEDCLDETDEV